MSKSGIVDASMLNCTASYMLRGEAGRLTDAVQALLWLVIAVIVKLKSRIVLWQEPSIKSGCECPRTFVTSVVASCSLSRCLLITPPTLQLSVWSCLFRFRCNTGCCRIVS